MFNKFGKTEAEGGGSARGDRRRSRPQRADRGFRSQTQLAEWREFSPATWRKRSRLPRANSPEVGYFEAR